MIRDKNPDLLKWMILIGFSLIGWGCSHGLLQRGGQPMVHTEMKTEDFFQQLSDPFTEGEITSQCKKAIDEAEAGLAKIVACPADQRSLERTLLAFENVMNQLEDSTSALVFMSSVSTRPTISEESNHCTEILSDFLVKVFTRRDLYAAIQSQKLPTSPDEARLLSETLKAFEKNGLRLPDAELAQVRDWMQELSRKEVEFGKNLSHDTSFVEFTEEQLKGLSVSFFGRLEKTATGKFKVTTKPTDFTEVMENASIAETRRQLLFAYMNRGGIVNQKLLEDALVLRQKIAKTLGFKNWVDYKAQDRMAVDSKTISHFLTGLKDKLMTRNQQDLDRLLKFKQKTEPTAKELLHWDVAYYSYQFKKENLNLDGEKIKEYFPASHVVSEMFDIYSKLLGVRFSKKQGVKAWASDVDLYQVTDERGSRSGQVIGYFYTDFNPRPLKYGHAAAFNLVHGFALPGGQYRQPIAAIVANFTPSSGKIPSLLSHQEVVTLFHEFGHIMHQVLTHAKYGSLAGSSVARDFVEAPSQMLENWVWSPEILTRISGHYLNLQDKLPPQQIAQLIAARDFNQGYAYCRQLYYGLLDFKFHTSSGPMRTTQVSDDLFKELFQLDSIEGGNLPATFGHLMGGYDAGYYGYLWSEVYAADLFSQFQTAGVMNESLGMKYRTAILEPGNMLPALDLVKTFLGREPDQKPFFKKLHLE
jgi:thimet oligopeptidase